MLFPKITGEGEQDKNEAELLPPKVLEKKDVMDKHKLDAMEKAKKQREMDVLEKAELLDMMKKAEKQKLAMMKKAKKQEFKDHVFNRQKKDKMCN